MLRYCLGYGPGRQRALEEEGHLLLVLHEAPSLGLAAFFFPMATLSAFLGANLNHIASDWKRYALFGLLGLAMGIGLTWIITCPVRQRQSSDGKTTMDDES